MELIKSMSIFLIHLPCYENNISVIFRVINQVSSNHDTKSQVRNDKLA